MTNKNKPHRTSAGRLYQSMTTVKLCVDQSGIVYAPSGSSDLENSEKEPASRN